MRDYQTIQDELNTIWDMMYNVEMHFKSLQEEEARLKREQTEVQEHLKQLRRDQLNSGTGERQ